MSDFLYELQRVSQIASLKPVVIGKILGNLRVNPIITMDKLKEHNFVTNEQELRIKDVLQEKKSIYITGKAGVGKTVLLNAILDEYMKDKHILYVYKEREINLDSRLFKNNKVDIMDIENLKLPKVAELIKKNYDWIVFDELYSDADFMLISLLSLIGVPVLTTCQQYFGDKIALNDKLLPGIEYPCPDVVRISLRSIIYGEKVFVRGIEDIL